MQVNIRHSYTQTLPNTYLEIGNGNNAYILRRVPREKSWHLLVLFLFEGSLEVKLPTIWTDDDRWKAEMGRVREEKRREEERERARRKKIQVREKVGKSRNTVFFQWFVALEVRSLKRRVRSQLARWEIKNCTPLWREAHLQVKKLKAPPVRTTFGSGDVEKAHAFVARSTFPSQNVQNTPGSDHFWKLRCRKSARRCGAKHISKSKCTKHTSSGTLLEVEMSKKCTRLWREARFEVKSAKNWRVRSIFGRSDVLSRGRRKGLCTLSKVSKTWGFCSISKNDGRRGTFEEDLQRCIFRGRRSTRDMFIRAVRRSGRWFPETGCVLEHQIFRFAEMILRGRCSTSYDLASLFRGRRSALDRWSGKIAKRIGTRPSALHSTFHFWRKSRRIASFFDVVNIEKWGSLAELLRFSRCQFQTLRKSRNCCVFDVVKFKNWGSLAE